MFYSTRGRDVREFVVLASHWYADGDQFRQRCSMTPVHTTLLFLSLQRSPYLDFTPTTTPSAHSQKSNNGLAAES